MEVFGFILPLWAVFIGIILIVLVIWKLIKFAIKILLVVVVFFAILIGLDFIGLFDQLSTLLTSFM